jgi:hypothetical protein
MLVRKKQVEVEAFCWNGETLSERPEWLRGPDVLYDGYQDVLLIDTLEGTMTARRGDWIIKGVVGEIYPCKPDIFAATYEPVPIDDNVIYPAKPDLRGPFPEED